MVRIRRSKNKFSTQKQPRDITSQVLHNPSLSRLISSYYLNDYPEVITDNMFREKLKKYKKDISKEVYDNLIDISKKVWTVKMHNLMPLVDYKKKFIHTLCTKKIPRSRIRS